MNNWALDAPFSRGQIANDGGRTMNEQELIDRAYGDTVETLYKVFFSEFTMAHGDEDSENAPKNAFAKASSTPVMFSS